ncbi:M13 family metallopeptidase [Namhaeicola litoreus]|uniref:M13 family metallopeptidase n=1 Tax=Namhaeicola litoreus TaxID=1052145 RepID=A0ABW3XX14_9FLAO
MIKQRKGKLFSPLFLALVLLSIVACQKTEKVEETEEKVEGIVLANMDPNVNPKDDFFNYVNGTWLKENEIPEDEVSWGGFNVLRKSTRKDLLEIISFAKESGAYSEETDQGKALLLFKSEMDTLTRDSLGVNPILPTLKSIDAAQNMAELQGLIAKDVAVSNPFIGFGVGADLNNSAMNTMYISPGRLGLPDRDYYINQDEKSKEIREQYKQFIVNLMSFTGVVGEQAQESAETILALETKLAEPRMDKVERRDARKRNNPRTLTELQTISPVFQWETMFKDAGIEKEVDSVIVSELKYMDALNKVVKTTPFEDVKTMVKWSTLRRAAGNLSTEMEKTSWDFYSKTLRGAKAQQPLDERALGTVTGSVGEALGKLYVDAKFPPEAKAKAEQMISNVIKAFQNRIQVLDWMSEDTKVKAIEKLENLTVKIGYPDKWEDYSKLAIKEGNSLAENMRAVQEFETAKNFSELYEPVDKARWGMAPQTVNAYFNPRNNEIVFPAAILQPPFYNYKADEAVNYGGMGAVIGHEISHAFDDSGSRYDKDGNLKNWWTDTDLEEFTKRGDALAEQYSKIEVLDSVFINGKFTLGENIGDLGGLLGAYDGLQLFFEVEGRPENIDGFSPEQRFFMSWATVWRTLMRDDALRNQILTDPHSPGMYRATQPLKNIDAFYSAFDVKEGDGMYLSPEERVRIW